MDGGYSPHTVCAFGYDLRYFFEFKTGNGHARRLLIDAAWHQRAPYRTASVELRRRWEKASPAAVTRGREGIRRLPARWRRFDARNQRATVANTAIARELAGWSWSLATLEE